MIKMYMFFPIFIVYMSFALISVHAFRCGVTSGDFKVCTILFSDVVTFTNICADCEPIQIVNMLNAMYSRFDRLTNVHDVYKVRRKPRLCLLSNCLKIEYIQRD